jgi:hypothetical protein
MSFIGLVSDSYMVKNDHRMFQKEQNKFQSGELNRSQVFRPLIVSDICQSKTPFKTQITIDRLDHSVKKALKIMLNNHSQ